MITGTVLAQALYVQVDTTGVGTAYATKAAFLAAGHAITWQDSSGTALSSQPVWGLSAGTADGRHVLNFVNPSGQWTAKLVPASGFIIAPAEVPGEGLSNDADTLYNQMLNTTGAPATSLTTNGDFTWYDGNSLSIDMTVLDTALTFIGATSLADTVAMLAEIKIKTKDSSVAADVPTLTETIKTDTLGARVVTVSVDAFPAAVLVPTGQQVLSIRCDLKLTKGGKSITAAVRNGSVLWKANT